MLLKPSLIFFQFKNFPIFFPFFEYILPSDTIQSCVFSYTITINVWYLPLKLSVPEDGLTAETGVTIQIFDGIGTLNPLIFNFLRKTFFFKLGHMCMFQGRLEVRLVLESVGKVPTYLLILCLFVNYNLTTQGSDV